MNAAQKKERQEKLDKSSALQCLEINNDMPLSKADWTYMSLIISEINALAWVQVLPVGHKSSQPFQFNNIHILPSQKIPFPKIPLDTLIASRIAYLKKREKIQKRGGASEQSLLPLSKFEQDAIANNITVIPEFRFMHGIFKITPSELNADGLSYAYTKLSTFLGLKSRAEDGLTIVVSPQWMFVATLNNFYHSEKDEQGRQNPVYLDGFAYAGIVNIQTIKQKWPSTGYSSHQQHSVLRSLEVQARNEKDEKQFE